MEQQEIIYFEINNWFCGRDYPPIEPFKTWVHTNRFSNDAWCKENKLVVMTGPIDMSSNWLVAAPRKWVEDNFDRNKVVNLYIEEINRIAKL